ncbi:hypothetical protein ACR8AL_12970 [Clavibacter sepedonicus]|uniref:Integral membrane protein n=1 Tax=Clavibacter sepedonicus TaxID=31964 RepID=B0RFM8_CLASE|nr:MULTISPECIES: hypothetical protein [Clavibacter]MBD5381378.1 hypothetical protein [Clavibacter sp.]OQJ47858.1 hypothetical protein B5P19_05880 [Clavibacter sepedonicus]OQJ53413.1 hypothetical protein B5P20_04135 [Clavibacter sepedonicus]UUK64595.1 hypothetical protein LRE50_09830 [Clavibacter sepedonicus]CAQ02247.1 putative integral membrane protein [Clavibacter sepedonicus]
MSRTGMRVLLAVAVLATAGGAVALVVALAQPVVIGSFASVGPGNPFRGSGVHFLTTTAVVGGVVLVAGLAGLALALGIRLGERARLDGRPPSADR